MALSAASYCACHALYRSQAYASSPWRAAALLTVSDLQHVGGHLVLAEHRVPELHGEGAQTVRVGDLVQGVLDGDRRVCAGSGRGGGGHAAVLPRNAGGKQWLLVHA